MAARLAAKGAEPDRIVEISNWATGSAGVVRGPGNRLRAEWGLQGKFVLVYSGNLGIGHEFDTLLEAFASALAQSADLRLVIIGKGSRLAEVVRRVDEMRLAHAVRFSDLLPAERLPESIGLADLAVVTLRPGFEGLIVPSKMLGYMSRGVPVLYIGPPSDVDAFIERHSCGIVLRNGDVAGAAEAILGALRDPARLLAMGESGRLGYEVHLARDQGLARYEAIVRACLASRSAARPT
jgi:glycosyltransferase involved in cell wall biosynthesis